MRQTEQWTALYLLEEKGIAKGCRRLDVPFGSDEVLTEGTRGAEITKGGMDVIEVRDIGANGVIVDMDVGMDKFGILPIPKRADIRGESTGVCFMTGGRTIGKCCPCNFSLMSFMAIENSC